MTIPMPELKPCPFCGKTRTLKVTTASEVFGDDEGFYEHTETYAVMCNASKPDGPGGCGADGGFKAVKTDAITAWNTRAAIEAATEQGKPQWLPIADAPVATNLLLLWRPIDHEKRPFHKEIAVGSFCYDLETGEPNGNVWANGMMYKATTHIIGWQPLPLPPTPPQGKI